MLEEVLRYINNRFETASVAGEFSIEDGTIEIIGAVDGQYFWVEGSVLNDGLHLYPATDLRDEDFEGCIWLLAVPPALTALADEITEWCSNNADAIGGPYQSESFGGYSYTMAGADAGSDEASPAAWQSKFGARLRQWRKLSREWV